MDDHADSAGAEIAELCQTLHKFDLDFAKKSQHEFTAEQALIDARDADAVRAAATSAASVSKATPVPPEPEKAPEKASDADPPAVSLQKQFKVASLNVRRLRFAFNQNDDSEELLNHWMSLGIVLAKCDAILLQDFVAGEGHEKALTVFHSLLAGDRPSVWSSLQSREKNGRCHLAFWRQPMQIGDFGTFDECGSLYLELIDDRLKEENQRILLVSVCLDTDLDVARAQLDGVLERVEGKRGIKIVAGDVQQFSERPGFATKIPENISTDKASKNVANIFVDSKTDKRMLTTGGALRIAADRNADKAVDACGLVDTSPLTLVFEEE